MAYEISTIGDLSPAPCCAPCASARATRRTAADDMVSMGAMGGDFLTIVWPSDVEAYKRKLDPDFQATESAASRCAELPTGEAMAWGEFFIAWKKFRDEPVGIFGTANKFDEAKAFEERLREWQLLLGKTCKLVSPAVVPPSLKEGPDLSALKWVAAAVAIVGVAYIASPFVMGARKLAR